MNAKQNGYFKMGLVVVLALVFIGAVGNTVMTIRKASPPPPPPPRRSVDAASRPPAPPVAPVAAAETTNAPAATPISKTAWPHFELAQIVAFDPFQDAKQVAAAAIAKSAGAIAGEDPARASSAPASAASGKSEPASSARIHAVYQRGSHTAAVVGSKTMRPGDQIEGAGRIMEVDQGGVVLEIRK